MIFAAIRSDSETEQVIWITVALVSTTLNAVVVLGLLKKISPVRFYDACILNFSLAYLIPGNVMFISMAFTKKCNDNSASFLVLYASFWMLTCNKLVTLILINLNQIYALRRIFQVTRYTLQSKKKQKYALCLAIIWLMSAIISVSFLFAKSRLVLIVSIFVFGITISILRLVVLRLLKRTGQHTSQVTRQLILNKMSKSIKFVLLCSVIELCTWLPTVIICFIIRSGETETQRSTLRWCLRLLFLTPIVYPFLNFISDTEARQFCLRKLRRNQQVEAILTV